MDKNELETLIEKVCDACARHIEAQQCIADSGIPPEVMIRMLAKTLRSADWHTVVRDVFLKKLS